MNRKAYFSDLTDAEWRLLAPFIPSALPGGRPRKHSMREVLDATFTLAGAAVRGVCYLMSSRRGRLFIITSAPGE
jgi:transposase